jgi:hypothetical protein
MKKISVNIKELTEIKDDLENTLKTWDSLLNVLEASMLEEDWKLVHAITKPTEKSIKRIKRILR